MGPALDQFCSGTFSACVAWVWHNEHQARWYIPNPRGATQNLMVRSCCWRHHRAESQRAEGSSWHSPANLMPTTYLIVLQGALHGTGITSHHQLKGTSEVLSKWSSEWMCIVWYETASEVKEWRLGSTQNRQSLSPGSGLERQTFFYPNTNKSLQVIEILKNKTKPWQQKTSNVSLLLLDVYTVILLPHRNLLLRLANSSPCAVHNKQDEILGWCSNKYVSIRACILNWFQVSWIFVSITYLVSLSFLHYL